MRVGVGDVQTEVSPDKGSNEAHKEYQNTETCVENRRIYCLNGIGSDVVEARVEVEDRHSRGADEGRDIQEDQNRPV